MMLQRYVDVMIDVTREPSLFNNVKYIYQTAYDLINYPRMYCTKEDSMKHVNSYSSVPVKTTSYVIIDITLALNTVQMSIKIAPVRKTTLG